MSLSIFADKAAMPDEAAFTSALGESKALWDNIKNHVATVCGNLSEQWKYYSKKAGWSLVVKSGERTILYLIPAETAIKVNFVFGDKAAIAAETAGLPEAVTALISEAARYAEGRSFMFDVTSEADVGAAKKLIEIKHLN